MRTRSSPSKPNAKRTRQAIYLRLEQDDLRALERYAERLNVPVTEAIRAVLRTAPGMYPAGTASSSRKRDDA